MASESPKISEPHYDGQEKHDLEKEPYDNVANGYEHAEEHVLADQLARKLSARQVQMIAIGKSTVVRKTPIVTMPSNTVCRWNNWHWSLPWNWKVSRNRRTRVHAHLISDCWCHCILDDVVSW
jgi:hypothetical protein